MPRSSIASLTPAERQELLSGLSDLEATLLLHNWPFWARPEQLPPEDPDWLIWLVLAGRGFGKTRVGAETTIDLVRRGQASRIALVGETAADCRTVMIEGESGILACSPPDFRPTYEPSKRRLTWPNGAMAYTYNATQPDQLRGPQHDFAWLDELAKWRYAQETWDQLQFGMRLGRLPRQVITTTPRPIPILKELLRDDTCRVTHGRTSDNFSNLPQSFIDQIHRRYGGTRMGRQELDGELLGDTPGALWTRDMIDKALAIGRRAPTDTVNSSFYRRIVVAVDPSGTDGDEESGGDTIGIIAAGLGQDNNGYIIQDASLHGSPARWGRRAVDLYNELGADALVAERNFGGAMVKHVIHTVDPRVRYREVFASRGKVARAEPVAALYEQGRIGHAGSHPDLEDQMCLMTRTGFEGRGSPDRTDAAVWAIHELMLASSQPASPVFGTY